MADLADLASLVEERERVWALQRCRRRTRVCVACADRSAEGR